MMLAGEASERATQTNRLEMGSAQSGLSGSVGAKSVQIGLCASAVCTGGEATLQPLGPLGREWPVAASAPSSVPRRTHSGITAPRLTQ